MQIIDHTGGLFTRQIWKKPHNFTGFTEVISGSYWSCQSLVYMWQRWDSKSQKAQLCCGEAALAAIDSEPGALALLPATDVFLFRLAGGRSGRLIGNCHILVSYSLLWFVYQSSTSMSVGVEIKTKLDVLGPALKWPTPVTERERKETVGVCSHNWRMQSREEDSYGMSWKWWHPEWIWNWCRYLNSFDHKWVSVRAAVPRFSRESGKRHEQPHHSCLWGLPAVTPDSPLTVLLPLSIKVILIGRNFLELKCSSYLSKGPETH